MHYVVFVELLDGSGRIDLADTDDNQAAADLVYGLTVAASGKGFNVGIAISPTSGEPEEARRPNATQRPPVHQRHTK